jgi:hypothetical protein
MQNGTKFLSLLLPLPLALSSPSPQNHSCYQEALARTEWRAVGEALSPLFPVSSGLPFILLSCQLSQIFWQEQEAWLTLCPEHIFSPPANLNGQWVLEARVQATNISVHKSLLKPVYWLYALEIWKAPAQHYCRNDTNDLSKQEAILGNSYDSEYNLLAWSHNVPSYWCGLTIPLPVCSASVFIFSSIFVLESCLLFW